MLDIMSQNSTIITQDLKENLPLEKGTVDTQSSENGESLHKYTCITNKQTYIIFEKKSLEFLKIYINDVGIYIRTYVVSIYNLFSKKK